MITLTGVVNTFLFSMGVLLNGVMWDGVIIFICLAIGAMIGAPIGSGMALIIFIISSILIGYIKLICEIIYANAENKEVFIFKNFGKEQNDKDISLDKS